MPAKKKSAKKRAAGRKATKVVRTERVLRPRRVVEVAVPEPTVDRVVTETDIIKRPRVEVRKPATLAQALTEPAAVVVKPETKVVRRVVKTKRERAA